MEGRAKNFVSVRVDSDEREDILRIWQVKDLPDVVFLTPEGGVLARNDKRPLMTPEDVQALMEQAETGFARLRKVEAAAAKSPRDPKRLMTLGQEYYRVKLWDRSAKTFDDLLAADPQNASGLKERVAEFRVFIDLMRARNQAAVDGAAAFEKAFPQGKSLAMVLHWRGIALLNLKKVAEATAAWEDVMKRFPEDPAAKLAREAITRAKQ